MSATVQNVISKLPEDEYLVRLFAIFASRSSRL